MSQTEPQPLPEPNGGDGASGRLSALVVYGLYLLSIPSAALFALVGVVIAYATRGDALGVTRPHLEKAIELFWIAAFWNIAFAILFGVGIVLTIVLIGIPLVWLAGAGWFVVMVWFTVMSGIGLVKLLDGRGP